MWVTDLANPQDDWPDMGGQRYVLDVLWQADPGGSELWHRKTFYGVTIAERGWEARDVESGLMEGQQFAAELMLTDGGLVNPDTPPAASQPMVVNYTDASGTVLLYAYNATTGAFTAQTTTTGRAVITQSPFSIQFAVDEGPVVGVNMPTSLTNGTMVAYRNPNAYRTANVYRTGFLYAAAVFAAPAIGQVPRLDFLRGQTTLFSVVAVASGAGGIYGPDLTEGQPVADLESYSALDPLNLLVAVLDKNLTAQVLVAQN